MDEVDSWSKDVFFGAPEIAPDTQSYCEETGDWMPVAFEWYKYTALLLYRFAQLGWPNGKGLRDIPNRHHAILKGLLVRASKIMSGSIKLIHEALHGDLLISNQRHALESMVKCRWLMAKKDAKLFDRFISAGLKDNIDLSERLEAIRREQGGTNELGKRLVEEVRSSYLVSGVTEEEVRASKNMPDFKRMMIDIGLEDHYFYFQSIPSSTIHGDWSDLIANHLEYDYDKGEFSIKTTPNEPKARVCFVGVSSALSTLSEYIVFAIKPENIANNFFTLIEAHKENFGQYLTEVLSKDFKIEST